MDDQKEKESSQSIIIMKKPILISGFILMVVLQWFVPSRMIFYKERIITIGKEFRFRTEPFDPYDAFRGKYVYLTFNQTSIQLKDSVDWKEGDMIFGLLSTDSSGFAHVTSLTKEEPSENVDYLTVTAGYVYQDSVTSVTFSYPFDRFYMEESKASTADEAYHVALGDTSKVTYAKVRIHKGEGVILDVYIDGMPLKEVAIQRQKQEEQVQ
jgi:uncharacterized membrane-anchored protein